MISTNLAAVGVVVSTGGRTSGGRVIRLEKVAGRSVISVTDSVNPRTSTDSDDASASEASPQNLFPKENDAIDANDAFSGELSSREPLALPQPVPGAEPILPGTEHEDFEL